MSEAEALNSKTSDAKARTEAILKERYGANRTLGFLPVNDRKRLYNLFIWEERYALSIEVILHILFDHYDTFRLREKRKRNMGLPVQAATLMSRNSEEILKEQIKLIYPNQEHVDLKKQLTQEKLISEQLAREHMITQVKPITEYQTVDLYIRDYDKKMGKLFGKMNTIRTYLKNNTKPYRTNPWR